MGICKKGTTITCFLSGNKFIVKEYIHGDAGWETYKVLHLQTQFEYVMKIFKDRLTMVTENKLINLLKKDETFKNIKMIPRVFMNGHCIIDGTRYYYSVIDGCGATLYKFWGKLSDSEITDIYLKLSNFLRNLRFRGFKLNDLAPTDILYNKRNNELYIINFNKLVIDKGCITYPLHINTIPVVKRPTRKIEWEKNNHKNFSNVPFNLIVVMAFFCFCFGVIYGFG